jgi:tRNA threonylcarbamoyladenosine biosynthesis protein TsaB
VKVLGVDTATRSCSVAVLIDDQPAAELAKVSDRTHSVHLMSMIRKALAMAALDLRDIDGFAVTVGPGSFTGLRIGISTVKGLAFSMAKPCVGVSTLEALAYPCLPCPHPVCTLMDARKGEVYAAFFSGCAERPERIGNEQVGAPEAILSRVVLPHFFVGDAVEIYADRIRAIVGRCAIFAPKEICLPKASVVARLAQGPLEAALRGEISRPVPRYIRQSDAELKIKSPEPADGQVNIEG